MKNINIGDYNGCSPKMKRLMEKKPSLIVRIGIPLLGVLFLTAILAVWLKERVP